MELELYFYIYPQVLTVIGALILLFTFLVLTCLPPKKKRKHKRKEKENATNKKNKLKNYMICYLENQNHKEQERYCL